MTKMTLMIYGFLMKIQLFFWHFPNDMLNGDTDKELMVALVTLALSLIVLCFALKLNGGSHLFLVKQAVTGIFVFLVTHITVLDQAGLDRRQSVPMYRPLVLALILGAFICFTAVNFLLDVELGKVLVLLYCSQFLFATAALKLWSYAYPALNGKYDYKELLITMKILKPFTSTMKKAGLTGLTGLVEFGILMFLMFVVGYFLLLASKYAPEEWFFAVVSRFFMAISYLIAEIWKDTTWRVDNAFFVFVMSCGGMLFYLFWFCYALYKKDQNGCVGVFLIGAAGALCDAAIVLGVDMSRRGGMGKPMKMLYSFMTWVYKTMPFGRHTDFSQSAVYQFFGLAITAGLTVGIILILFYIWERTVDIDDRTFGIGKGWFRNSSLLLIMPVVFYWADHLWGNFWTDSIEMIDIAYRAMMGLGAALCVSNMAGALGNGFIVQLKRVFVSSVVSLFIVCLIVPIIVAAI